MLLPEITSERIREGLAVRLATPAAAARAARAWPSREQQVAALDVVALGDVLALDLGVQRRDDLRLADAAPRLLAARAAAS